MNWAGLGWAGVGTGRRGRLQTEPMHTSGAASQSWGEPALPCAPEPADLGTHLGTGTAGFPAARPARPNRLQLMDPGLGSMGPRHSLGNLQSGSSLNETDVAVTVPYRWRG